MSTLPIDKTVYYLCTNDITVASIIAKRMYPGVAPQTINPETHQYLSYTFSGVKYIHTLLGRDTDCSRDLIISGICNSEINRMALTKAIVDVLDPIGGPWPKTVTVEGESIILQGCFLEEGGEDFEEPGLWEEGSDTFVYPFKQTYKISYSI